MSDSPSARRHWLWYFVILGVLTAGGITANLWYNLRQQLDPEQLEAARRRWQQNGPRDYRLEYTVKREVNPDPAGPVPQWYSVLVRDGKVASVTDADGRALQANAYEFDSMDSLFAFIDRQLGADAEPGKPRAFVTAMFAASDGHVTHYVHSVMQTRERLEVKVELVHEMPSREH